MDKRYDHTLYEEKIYALWEKSGSFTPKIVKDKKPFTIIMPPPNANDPLHVGHAMFIAVEDILIRYNRMKGRPSLWLPGTDHAGIETQFVFEKRLIKKGKSRFDYDRETLYKMVWDYVQENSDIAVNQMKRLGASADWSRFKFTLDPDIIDLVLETFIKLYKDKLVYRGERLVNYCVKCGTGYSELEVEYKERIDPLYYIRYRLKTDNKKYIVIATTRPEPIWVDTHIAVNPKDKKNKHLIGKKVINPLTNREMEIIGDSFVDPEFGTGIVKLTPAHDHKDHEVAQKHNLPVIQAIDTNGRMMGGPSAGEKVAVAREEALKILEEKDLIEKINSKYSHRIGTCYRCHRTIEPLPLPQFFINIKPLVASVLKVLDKKQTTILGAGMEKTLRHWLTNIKDWNISRQIVWGIRIPVWYSIKENPEMEVVFLDKKKIVKGGIKELLKKHTFKEIEKGLQKVNLPKEAKFKIAKASPGKDYLQETDTFDTWFSSGQWPVITLKANKRGDFGKFYPTTVMETGYDILPIWVMRMMLLGIYMTGETPFETVYLHGLIRDERGRKMSKSIGNVMNPLDMVEKYGADALRFALVVSSVPGQDRAVGDSTIRGMRNFSNKIWNAARYVFEMDETKKGDKDKEVVDNLKANIKTITERLDNIKIGQAAELSYAWFWHTYCDRYIELSKKGLVSKSVMLSTLKANLKLLHPFMPFVTEAIWSLGYAKNKKDLLITTPWPK